jgi:all-trans-nonaprenyl-diphosphate synthase
MEEQPFLTSLIEREFSESNDFQQAMELIHQSSGIERSRTLAADHARIAVDCLNHLPTTTARQALHDIADYVLRRIS